MSDEQWYVVCDSTGNSVSIGTVVADPLPAGLSSVPLSDADAESLRSGNAEWDAATQSVRALPMAVPASVSPRQLRIWLVQHGISMAAIDSVIDGIADQLTRETVRVEWEYAPYVERAHPWLIPLAQALGLEEEQVDQAFREASQI
jgi:predicted component of type VI protein secretion system